MAMNLAHLALAVITCGLLLGSSAGDTTEMLMRGGHLTMRALAEKQTSCSTTSRSGSGPTLEAHRQF